tara:strand:- start:36 stop:179 length:144 start_codon:yes stop_codon:yes gene_type:complete
LGLVGTLIGYMTKKQKSAKKFKKRIMKSSFKATATKSKAGQYFSTLY